MAFDSLIRLLSAAVLLAVCIASWVLAAQLKPAARSNLRFAAMLLAAGAVAAPFPLVGNIAALLILPPACTALALASLARFALRAPPLPASIALAAALAFSLGTVAAASPLLAAIPAMLAACVLTGAALQDFAWIAALSGLALLAAVFAFLAAGAGPGLLLFAAVALLAFSRSALAVEQQGDAWGRRAIGPMR